MPKTAILVIFGGKSLEHKVSLDSVQDVLGGLSSEKYDVITMGISKTGKCILGSTALPVLLEESKEYTGPQDVDLLRHPENMCRNIMECLGTLEVKIDVIFPLIHGANGEDGRLQGMLDFIGVPYIGSGVSGSVICMDKLFTKAILDKIGIRQLPYVGFTSFDWKLSSDSIILEIESLGYPIFIKPANLGSSIGITKVKSRESLRRAIEDALVYDSRILAEKGLESPREIEFSVLGNDDPIVSVAGENIIYSHHEFYTYEAKYTDTNANHYRIPPENMPIEMLQGLQRDAKKAYRAVAARGLARVDFFVDRDTGGHYLNEINTMPEFTKMSMYPKLLEASSIGFSELLDRLIDLAMKNRI